MKKAQRLGGASEGKSVYDFEQIKETVEEDKVNDEILSIPNKVKFDSTVLYMGS
jgi:hypothetical protein